MEEYEEDELADNSDNEKRQFRAEQRAGRKVKAAAAKSKRKEDFLKKDWRPRFQSGTDISETTSGQQAMQLSSSAPPKSTPVVQGLGPRFICGKLGHFRNTCPLVQNNVNK